ncbi:(R)-mandelonitrile lyase 1-like [Humulus lupulus]|uniref:(R)-mandelonitrile lyase 1-like n=1 Tax=Humulus lupulus TaxID=3486 RepID=UPI002B402D64|nr:(R)-mandelonitrile lyase 1-like [Humulus lupulus]
MVAASFSLLLLIVLTSFHGKVLSSSFDHDFSYMKSVQNATELPLEEEYDYIVIGGGTAGCPLAATLSEKYSVLVLERGDVPESHPNVLSVAGFFANLMQEDDGNTPAQRFTSEDGVENVRGRVLGGTSMLNAGFFSRADSDLFLSELGLDLDMDSVVKAYEWVEETVVSRPASLAVWQSAFKDALVEAGVGPDNGFTLDHVVGTKASGSTFDDMGRRHGAVELLNRGDLNNLRIAVRATVERVIFSRDQTSKNSNPSASGVVYTDSKGKSHTALVRRPCGEVILSAGTLGTPQLLLLSGIGPHDYLSSLNIPIIHSQPNVGKFMADNPRNNINLMIPFPLDPSPPQVAGIAADYYIETVSYTLPFTPTPSPFSLLTPSSSSAVSVATIADKLSRPLSHGTLRLASPVDVKTSPLVRFNYFENPADLAMCVGAVRKMGEMLETKSMDQFKYKDLKGSRGFLFAGPALPANQSDDSAMEAFCKSSVTTFWHYHGGCLVGKVVDGDFRVMGTNALRVLDGSTFRMSPGTNPQATLMMLGRYIGLKMLSERREPYYNLVESQTEIY